MRESFSRRRTVFRSGARGWESYLHAIEDPQIIYEYGAIEAIKATKCLNART